MNPDEIKAKRKKPLKKVKKCPKCGNTEGIITIPGSDTVYYMCPVCSPKKEPPKDLYERFKK